MTAMLLFSDALHSPWMRHELGEPLADTVVFVEHDSKRTVAGRWLDAATLSKREDVVDEFWDVEELGYHELVEDDSLPHELIWPELTLRTLQRAGATKVVVPPDFPVFAADYLRDRGIDLVVDEDSWVRRRRYKTPGELEGIERAQRAADTAMLAAARMIGEAEPTATGGLRFEGEILTAELMREALASELGSQGTESREVIVHSGDAWRAGHEPGRGPIAPDTSCIIDLGPRDRRSGAHTDMSRTFVAGRPSTDLLRLHEHCRKALEVALEAIRPGRSDAYARVCEYFHDNGFDTLARNRGATSGFLHDLGHGVGLEVHERPWMGRRADELIEGDVVAIEPALYVEGIGGVRLEDTVLVTEDGPRHFTQPFPYDLQP